MMFLVVVLWCVILIRVGELSRLLVSVLILLEKVVENSRF